MIGQAVPGYRAPSFSVSPETSWALPILVEEGHVYDSSIFPILHDRYGWRGANPLCHQVNTPAGPLWEIPPSTIKIAGIRIQIAGGGYLRLLPYRLLRLLMRQVANQGCPLVIYVHPWELDPDQPRMNGPWWSRFRHYTNLSKTESRLLSLLGEFSFAPICEAMFKMSCTERGPAGSEIRSVPPPESRRFRRVVGGDEAGTSSGPQG